jgi:hypothetical protein
LQDFYSNTNTVNLYCRSGDRYWRKALMEKLSTHYKHAPVHESHLPQAFCLLNSQFFYWYWITNSNCMDVVACEVDMLPTFDLHVDDVRFSHLHRQLFSNHYASMELRERRGEIISTEEFNFDVENPNQS